MGLFDDLTSTLDSTLSDVADSAGAFVSDRVTDITGQAEAAPAPAAAKPAGTIAGYTKPAAAAGVGGSTLVLIALAYFFFFRR